MSIVQMKKKVRLQRLLQMRYEHTHAPLRYDPILWFGRLYDDDDGNTWQERIIEWGFY